MQIDIEFLKTKANYIRYSYIQDMEKYLLSFETGICNHNPNIVIKWIKDEENLFKEFKSSLSKSSYNKVCFDREEVSDIFFEKKNFISKVTLDDILNANDIAEHLVVHADYGIVDNSNIVFVNNQSLNFVNNVKALHIILNLNDFIVKKQDLETILFLKYDCYNNPSNFPKDIKFLSSFLNQVVSNSIQISQGENYSVQNIPIYIYLFDNNVTDILEDPFIRETLFCIHCGKCKEVCPVYKITQNLSPIQLIKDMYFSDNTGDISIFQNTTLCGNCNEVCPVQIPFTDLLIYQMQQIRKVKSSDKSYSLYKILSKRGKMNKLNHSLRRFFFINRYYKNNKKLQEYYRNQKNDFFNITYDHSNE